MDKETREGLTLAAALFGGIGLFWGTIFVVMALLDSCYG